jgi:membrane-associated phospholipid phosphatase
MREGALVWSVILGAGAALLAGIAYYAATGNDGAFAEFGPLSTLKLAGAFAVAVLGISYFRRFWEQPDAEQMPGAGGTLFWPLAGVGLLWITLDDYLQIHERVADLLPDWSVLQTGEVVFAGYLIAGITLARFFRRELVTSPPIATLVVAGLLFSGVMVVGDAIISGESPWASVEEGAHLAAVAAFLCAFIVKYRAVGGDGSGRPVRAVAAEAARTGIEPTPRNVAHWASWVITLAVFLGLTVLLLPGQVYGWEVDVTRWAQDADYPDWAFTLTADRLTNSDTEEGATIILSVAAVLVLLRLPLEAILLLFAVPLHILANFPKAFMDRERPSELIEGLTGFGGLKSFPSGHAEFAVVFYGFIAYVALLHVHNRVGQGLILLAWVGMCLAVGYARLSVGKHWPLDMVAGYVIGIGILSGLIWLHTHLDRAVRSGTPVHSVRAMAPPG